MSCFIYFRKFGGHGGNRTYALGIFNLILRRNLKKKLKPFLRKPSRPDRRMDGWTDKQRNIRFASTYFFVIMTKNVDSDYTTCQRKFFVHYGTKMFHISGVIATLNDFSCPKLAVFLKQHYVTSICTYTYGRMYNKENQWKTQEKSMRFNQNQSGRASSR